MMKYLIYFIIGLFLFFGLKNFAIANEGNMASENNNNESAEGSSGLTHILSENSIITGDLFTGFFDGDPVTTLDFGDLAIEEVFPGSGNCLDEYIIITSHRDFSGYIDILGAGVSSGIITIRVNLYSGEQIIVTDNVAGIKTTKQIILLPSITLTNGGEVLQLRHSGSILDDILYSDPRVAKSLVFTESLLGKRYFKTIKDSQLQTYCFESEFITPPSSIIGGCSIGVSDFQDNGSGHHTLSLTISSLSGCLEGALNKRYVGSIQTDVNVCQTSIALGPGLHRLQYYGYSETGILICSDELYFASRYDVGYIQTQHNSPGQCQNSQVRSIQSNQPITYYESKNCGIELQSPKLGFTINSALNVRLLIDGTGLSNSQSNYSCEVDFGNGEKIEECNPSSFYYKIAGIYTIGISIKDSRTGQPICSHTSFLYVPSGPIIKDIKNTSNIHNNNEFFASTGLYCSGLLPGLNIYSLLPNPKGSDTLQEELILKGTFGDIDLSQFILKIGKKSFNLSGVFVGQKLNLKSTFGLLNKGMCLDLIHKDCGTVQHICYTNTKESEVVYCPYGEDVICYISGDIHSAKNNLSKDNACVEKINKLKNDHKSTITALREKQKNILLKLRSDAKVSIQKLKDKERISRNSRYIRERSFQIVYDALKHGELPMMLFIRDIHNINNYLISRLDKKNYFLSQYEKPKIYTYDIKKYIAKYVSQDSLLLYFFPDLYMDILNYQFFIENE